MIKCEIVMFCWSFQAASYSYRSWRHGGELESGVCRPVWAEEAVVCEGSAETLRSPPDQWIQEPMMTSRQLYFLTGSCCTITVVVVVLRSSFTKIVCEQEVLLVFLNLAVLSELPHWSTVDIPNSSQTVDDEAPQTRLGSLVLTHVLLQPISPLF